MDWSSVEIFGTPLSEIDVFGTQLSILIVRAGFLVLVVAVAFVVQHLLVKACRKALESIDSLPSASLLINCVRGVVWAVALAVVLYPVFGIQPATLLTAMGVVSVAVSLGLKDTISNVFGGIMLIAGRVVHPGDYVTIAGVTGTVVDVTLRHTVIENRLDEQVVIPNSVLNTTSIQRLPAKSESLGTFEFTMGAGNDPDVVAADILATVKEAAADALRDDMEPRVMFDSITPYGVKGQVFFYVKEDVPFAGVRNAMVRAIAQKDYFSLSGARALAEGEEGGDAAGTR